MKPHIQTLAYGTMTDAAPSQRLVNQMPNLETSLQSTTSNDYEYLNMREAQLINF